MQSKHSARHDQWLELAIPGASLPWAVFTNFGVKLSTVKNFWRHSRNNGGPASYPIRFENGQTISAAVGGRSDGIRFVLDDVPEYLEALNAQVRRSAGGFKSVGYQGQKYERQGLLPSGTMTTRRISAPVVNLLGSGEQPEKGE